MKLKTIIHDSLTIFALGYAINLVWEVLHSQLYDYALQLPTAEYIPRILKATIGDALALVLIYFLLLIVNQRQWRWGKKEIILTVILGILFAAAIEINGLRQGKWWYSASMPTIFGLGLTPLIQLALTALTAFTINNRLWQK